MTDRFNLVQEPIGDAIFPYWIGVDLDGTLAENPTNFPDIGKPVPRMVQRVKGWLAHGSHVKIMTARVALVSHPDDPRNLLEFKADQIRRITEWCIEHLGTGLPVTCQKDMYMLSLWDDRAVTVVRDTGESLYEFIQ